jgi:hypothetical protein
MRTLTLRLSDGMGKATRQGTRKQGKERHNKEGRVLKKCKFFLRRGAAEERGSPLPRAPSPLSCKERDPPQSPTGGRTGTVVS